MSLRSTSGAADASLVVAFVAPVASCKIPRLPKYPATSITEQTVPFAPGAAYFDTKRVITRYAAGAAPAPIKNALGSLRSPAVRLLL